MTLPIFNKGDIVTIKCRVEIGTKQWDAADVSARVCTIDDKYAHKNFDVTADNFDRLVRHHFEVGQTVSKRIDGRTHIESGVVESITASGNWLVVNIPGRVDEPSIWAADKCEPVPIAESEPDFAEVDEAPQTPPMMESAAE